jgi:diguanylate cyclase (GGDEF)-like protein
MKATECIMVVDDDPSLRKTLVDILKVKGYAVVVAANGKEAVTAAEHGPVSLALIDLMLPDMPGLEVMARIKAISPMTETIILTGHASMETAIEATRQGAYCYLLKPYQMDELLRHIRQALERKQAQEEIQRLASFPRMNPSPIIEIDTGGNLTYLNPAAESLFTELGSTGLSHPLLRGSVQQIADLQLGRQAGDVVTESRVGDRTYELHISCYREAGLIRVYVLDISQRKRDEEEIYLLATTDSLTGITNRREFNTILAREVAHAARYDTPLSLVMFDIDHFKHVNDTFGHDIGDEVLKDVTGLVKVSIRAADIFARWGGEEFMLLMPQTNLQAAITVAEKLRGVIADHHFHKLDRLTASFGASAFGRDDDTHSLLKRVDDALYRAKENGRNRVEIIQYEEAGA